MLARRPVFPGVIEMNHQAGWRIGCNVYLVYDDGDWVLVDIGYDESVDEITLRRVAERDVRRRLLAVPGVALVNAMGGAEKEYQVVLDP